MSFSIIIPVYNEEECIGFVIDEIRQLYKDAEIIVVNDGSTDNTHEIINKRADIKTCTLDSRKGQSHATWIGLHIASNDICVLMDGDGESDPSDIQKMISIISTCDYCCGYRIKRKRSFLNKMSSVVANKTRQLILSDKARDTGAMKVIRKKHIQALTLFPSLHRYIPSFLHHAGLSMREVPIKSRKRIGGKTKYTVLKRAILGVTDLIYVRKLLLTKRHARHTI